MWSGDDHGELGPADNTCSFQIAKFGLGEFQFVWIQAAGFCKNRAAGCFNKMADSMTQPRRPLTITHNAGKRRQEGADSRNDVRNGRGKFWMGRRCSRPPSRNRRTERPVQKDLRHHRRGTAVAEVGMVEEGVRHLPLRLAEGGEQGVLDELVGCCLFDRIRLYI